MGNMDNRDDKKNIHFNPDFIARRSETQVKSKFHVNPAFFQKSGSHQEFLRSVQQNSTSTENSCVLNKESHQTSSPPKSVQNLSSTIQASSITPVHLESYRAGSSANVVYNPGNQRPVFVNSQCGYSSYTPQSRVSYINSTKPSLYSWRTNPASLPHTRIPVNSSSSSRFRYQSQIRVKDDVSKFDGNIPELAKSKFKIDNRTDAHNVERRTKQGFEKYCIVREREKAYVNDILERRNSKNSAKVKSLGQCRTVDTVKKECVNDKLRKINDSVPFVKRRGAYSLSNVKHGVDKPNSSSVTSNFMVFNPTYNDKNFTSVRKEPSLFTEVNANSSTKDLSNSQFESSPRISPVKGSNILINPILLKSLSSSDKVDILAIASKSSPKKMVPSLLSNDSKLASVVKPSPSAVSKYKVISKTKLVRRRSRSLSKTKLSTPAKEIRPENLPIACSVSLKKEGSHITLCRPSPVFPTRPHSILAKNHLKRRYAVISRNKLVRRLSGSSSLNDDALERPKYTIKTNTKLVKKYSTSALKSVKYSSKVHNGILDNEKKKNYMVLSKTKLIRRKPNVGLFKAKILKDANRSNTRTIIHRHKLVRNVPFKSGKVSVLKNLDIKGMRRINTKYKLENRFGSLSAKQKAAKGIVSKYRINRLKVDSPTLKRTSNKRFTWVSGKTNNLQGTKKRESNSFSDRFVNIGGILYKATKTSLHKQIAKEKMINVPEKGSKCILKLHGNQYSVSASGRTLTRIESKPSSAATPLLSRVHIGGLTYSRTKTGHYELTKAHQARAVLSSAKHRSMITLSQKKRRGTLQKRNQNCIFFNRFGRCTKKDKGDCPYLHDATQIAICTRFLRGRCPVSNCPFSHKIDPGKMPVCSHFVRSICTREGCPYRHVRVSPNAPFCIDFLHGHCPLGQECKKQHVLECEEFSTSGKCPRGEACPLSHRKGSRRKRKSISLEPVTSSTSQREMRVFQPRRRKSNDSVDVLGEPSVKQKKKKVIVAYNDGILKRYFSVEERNLPHSGNSALVKDTQNNDLNERKDEIEMDLESSPLPGVSRDNSKEQSIANVKMKDETPAGTLDLEQKRGKLLQKIERLKEIYESPGKKESDGDKNEDNKREIHDNATKEAKDDSKDFKCDAFERRPLPKKMPSFISLSRDVGDVEDL